MYYTSLKILHYAKKVENLSSRRHIDAPIHVRIKPTNFCNHNCWYCSYQNSYGQLGKDMVKKDEIPYKKLLEIVNDCEEMNAKAITFSGGGEPLLYPHIVNIFEQFYKVKLAVLSNGIFLNGSIAEVLAKKATWLRISIDGWDRNSYARYRKCGVRNYDVLIENVKNFIKLKSKCVLGISIVVDQDNVNHLCEVVTFWNGLGIKNIKLSPVIISNDVEKNKMYHSSIEKIFEKQLYKIDKRGIDVYHDYYAKMEGFEKDYTWCPYIQILPIIGADQNVYCCHDKAYNKDTGILGSIKNERFRDFWFNGKEKFFKIDPKIHCQHHCVTHRANKVILDYLSMQHREFV